MTCRGCRWIPVRVRIPDTRDPLTGEKVCGLVPDPDHKGSLSAEEYDQMVYDLVNFLAYSAEPMKEQRQQLGIYVFHVPGFLWGLCVPVKT